MADVAERAHIAIVDDEEMVLTSIRSFLVLETDYEVSTFLSPKEAISFIRDHEADLVLSDFLMPEMDGISFLSRVRELKSEIPRIILTGYADKKKTGSRESTRWACPITWKVLTPGMLSWRSLTVSSRPCLDIRMLATTRSIGS